LREARILTETRKFEYINEQAKMHQEHNRPVISVDTKKKELIGNFKNVDKEITHRVHQSR
jgi:hypothetical protein